MNIPNILYLSDIHLEFLTEKNIIKIQNSILSQPDFTCVLAGDIGNPFHISYINFLTNLSPKFKKIFRILQ
jgi:predicted phosphodiesterase